MGAEFFELFGVLVGVGLQAYEDVERDDLRPGQKMGRAFLSALPLLSTVSFGAAIVFGPERVDQVKADFFSPKNPYREPHV